MGIADSMKKAAFSTAFSYIGKNPEENAPKLMAWVDKFAGEGPDSFPSQEMFPVRTHTKIELIRTDLNSFNAIFRCLSLKTFDLCINIQCCSSQIANAVQQHGQHFPAVH